MLRYNLPGDLYINAVRERKRANSAGQIISEAKLKQTASNGSLPFYSHDLSVSVPTLSRSYSRAVARAVSVSADHDSDSTRQYRQQWEITHPTSVLCAPQCRRITEKKLKKFQNPY